VRQRIQDHFPEVYVLLNNKVLRAYEYIEQKLIVILIFSIMYYREEYLKIKAEFAVSLLLMLQCRMRRRETYQSNTKEKKNR